MVGEVYEIKVVRQSMIKYFCDICGKELSIADRVQIPTDLDFEKTQNLIQDLGLGSAITLLCFECYSKLQDKYKDYLEKSKKSKKIVCH